MTIKPPIETVDCKHWPKQSSKTLNLAPISITKERVSFEMSSDTQGCKRVTLFEAIGPEPYQSSVANLNKLVCNEFKGISAVESCEDGS